MATPTINQEEFIEFFHLLVGTLDTRIRDILGEYWRAKPPLFFITNEQINRLQSYSGKWLKPDGVAATDGSTFVFDLARLSTLKAPSDFQTSLIAVTYHEIAHAYLFAKGEFNIIEIRRSRNPRFLSALTGASDPFLEEKCEKRADGLEQLWLKKLKETPAILEPLKQHSLIQKIAAEFHLAPI